MNNFHENIYINILKEYLSKFHTTFNEIDPIEINRAKFYVRSIYIAYVFANNETGKKLKAKDVKKWISTTISSECLFVKVLNDVDPILVMIMDNQNIPPLVDNIGMLYERLLNIETRGFQVVKGKEYRNNLGSYYTPKSLADALIEKAINIYINDWQNNILDAKIVDFSCGAGIFLVGAIEYVSSLFDPNKVNITNIKKRVACNIHACDVDPIALEVALINILQYISDYSLYPILCKNFYLANFLVRSKEYSHIEERLDIAKNGFIYHRGLSFEMFTQQKYDIILGNPPWEKIRFEEKSFYSQYLEQLDNINFKFELPSLINQISEVNSKIHNYADLYKSQLEDIKIDIKQGELFKDSCYGELNTCTLFVDAAFKMLLPNGVLGLIIKSSMVTSPINRFFFNKIKYNIESIHDFINKNKIFDIDSRERFSLLIMSKKHNEDLILGMNLKDIKELTEANTKISIDNLTKLNPETEMLPNIESIKDLNILFCVYNKIDVLSKSFKDLKYGRLVHLTNHIDYLDKECTPDNIPIYEGKFFHIFDGLYSGFNDVPVIDRYKSKASSRKLTEEQKLSGIYPQSRFYIKRDKWQSLSKQYNSKFMLVWRSLTSASNARTCIATILPFIPASQSVQFLTTESNTELLYLASIFNSIAFDYIIKCKLNGIDLTQAILNQIPVPSISYADNVYIIIAGSCQTAKKWLLQIGSLLLSNDIRLSQICQEVDIANSLLYKYDRHQLLLLLDIVVCKLYGFTLDELTHILTKFEKYYSKDDALNILKYYTE